MKGKALKLMKIYLYRRFLQVVAMGKASNLKEIFSGVPQGARWSPGLWNFDIHDLPDHVLHGELFSYADDLVLWYEITEESRITIIRL